MEKGKIVFKLSKRNVWFHLLLGLIPLYIGFVVYNESSLKIVVGYYYFFTFGIQCLLSIFIPFFVYIDLANFIGKDNNKVKYPLIFLFTMVRCLYYYCLTSTLWIPAVIDFFTIIMWLKLKKVFNVVGSVCPKCGRQCAEGEKFCGGCGQARNK